jgi:hypothetical protein
MTNNEPRFDLGRVTDSQAAARHKAAEREMTRTAAATARWEARIRAKTVAMVERARREYGDPSPEVASTERIADATHNVVTSPVSGEMLPDTESASDEAKRTRWPINAWISNFHHRRGRVPPLTVLRGGKYETDDGLDVNSVEA